MMYYIILKYNEPSIIIMDTLCNKNRLQHFWSKDSLEYWKQHRVLSKTIGMIFFVELKILKAQELIIIIDTLFNKKVF